MSSERIEQIKIMVLDFKITSSQIEESENDTYTITSEFLENPVVTTRELCTTNDLKLKTEIRRASTLDPRTKIGPIAQFNEVEKRLLLESLSSFKKREDATKHYKVSGVTITKWAEQLGFKVPSKQKSHDPEYKNAALKRLADGESVPNVAEDLGINSKTLHNWNYAFKKNGYFKVKGKRPAAVKAVKKEPKKIKETSLSGDFDAVINSLVSLTDSMRGLKERAQVSESKCDDLTAKLQIFKEVMVM